MYKLETDAISSQRLHSARQTPDQISKVLTSSHDGENNFQPNFMSEIVNYLLLYCFLKVAQIQLKG